MDRVLDQVLVDLYAGKPKVALTNMTHAVQAAHGFDVPRETRERLDEIVRLGGAFA